MLKSLIAAFATSLLISGCASYQLGSSSAEPDYATIFVAPPRNQSSIPQLEAPLNAALRDGIEKAPTLSVASQETAEAILEISVLQARREIAAVSPSDVGRARKFEITIDAMLSLRSLKAPDTYYFRDRALTVTVDVFTDSGQVSAERQVAVEIARKIAVDATELIQEVW